MLIVFIQPEIFIRTFSFRLKPGTCWVDYFSFRGSTYKVFFRALILYDYIMDK